MAGELGVHDRIGNLPAERFQVEEYSVDEDYYVEVKGVSAAILPVSRKAYAKARDICKVGRT